MTTLRTALVVALAGLLGVMCKATDAPSPAGIALAPAPPPAVAPEGSEGSEPTPAPPEPTEHVVQPGDTFWGLAMESGCSVDAIKRASGIESDIIYPGQTLRIPACGPAGAEPAPAPDAPPAPRPELVIAGEYRIQAGDVLEAIASRHGCSVSELMVANDLRSDAIYAGRTLRIPECVGGEVDVPVAAGEYRVRPGDFLFGIASAHGCSVGEIMATNGLASDFILAGQVLRIPDDCTGEVSGPGIVATLDTDTLPRLMRERGFRPPRQFKALVIEITFDSERRSVTGERRFAYEATADDTDWNPASSIKLFAAVAAMQRARDLGFSGDALVTFHGTRDRTLSLDELIQAAIGPSDNIAYNRLVQFVGYDEMNAQFLSPRNGLRHTALRRPYEQSEWMRQGEASSFRDTPAITIREGSRIVEVPERRGTAATACGGAACTSLLDLGELMRRLMLQEQLPAGQSFDLPTTDLHTLRRTMRTDRERGDEVVDALARDFAAGSRFYHKAGFAGDWYSDNVYVFDPSRGQAWIVVLAGYPGRGSLTAAAETIGALIADGTLRRN